MSTNPYQTALGVSLDIAGSQIKTTYTSTSLGTGLALGAYPRLAGNLALAFAGGVTTYTARITVQTTTGGAWKPVLCTRRDGSTLAAEFAMTASDYSDLLTAGHAGALFARLEVKANQAGAAGDTVYGALVGCVP